MSIFLNVMMGYVENYKQQISLPHVGHAGGVLSFLGNVGRKTSPTFPVLACSHSQEGTRVGCGITTTEIPPEPPPSLNPGAPALPLSCFSSCFSSSSHEPKADTATLHPSPAPHGFLTPGCFLGSKTPFQQGLSLQGRGICAGKQLCCCSWELPLSFPSFIFLSGPLVSPHPFCVAVSSLKLSFCALFF